MDPLDFLRVARDLSASAQEAEWRTSIGRSYFAVFNYARIRIEPLKPLPKTGDVHSLVVQYLTSANNKQLQSVGQTLKDLRTIRNEADYETQTTIDRAQSQVAILKAENAIVKSTSVADPAFAALMNALPTFRREQGIP